MRRVGEIVRARRDALPVILTADLNLPPHSDAVAALANHGLVDAFAVARSGAPAATVYQRIRAATSTVTRRVDYVFVGRGRALVPEVRGSRVVLTHDVAQRDNLRVGRHDGIVAVIETLKGHPLFAHITLTRSERSPIAAMVTDLLDELPD